VNTSGEKNKGGVEPSEIAELINHILGKCPNLHLLGLMTIGSLMESKNANENADFALLRRLRDEMAEQFERKFELSMGMSTDYALGLFYNF
jgi:PLP dependent protein